VKKFVRQLGAVLVGFPILIIGIILIPLPGPGILVCCVGLFVLSLGGFEWADRYLQRARTELKKIYKIAKERADKIENAGKNKK
jgi:hypothetical protein